MKLLIVLLFFVLISSGALASLGTYEPGQTVTFAVICLTNEGVRDNGCSGAGSGILDPDDITFTSPTTALAEVSDSVAPGLWRGNYLIPTGNTLDGTWSVFLNLTNSNSTSASGILNFQVVNKSFNYIGSNVSDILIDTGSSGVRLNSTLSTSINSIEGDSNELQTNQGNWITATGFLTDINAKNNFSDIASNFTAVMLDLDNPDQYKATGFLTDMNAANNFSGMSSNFTQVFLDLISVNNTIINVNTTMGGNVWTHPTRTLTSIAWTIFTAWDTFQKYVWNTTSRTITSFPFNVGLNSTAINDIDTMINVTHGSGFYITGMTAEQNSTLYNITDDIDLRMNETHGTGAFGGLSSNQNITLYGIAKDVWTQIMGGGQSANVTMTQINETVTWIELNPRSSYI